MPTLTTQTGRACLRTWWPDQLAGTVIAVYSLLALLVGGQEALDGVGVSYLLPVWAMQGWFALLALSGVSLVVATERDRAGCTAAALGLGAALLALNAVATVGPNGHSALGAVIAYTVASIYMIKRAQDALMVRIGRKHADGLLEKSVAD